MKVSLADLRALAAASDAIERLKVEAQAIADDAQARTGVIDFFEVPAGGLFDVRPERALAYFQAKGLRPTFSYADMLGAAHDQAFTVAKLMDVDLLAQVRDSLTSALAAGTPLKEWSKQLRPQLEAAGWWGRQTVIDPVTNKAVKSQLGSPWRLDTIFRTNMQTAYAAQAWQEIEEQADLAPYLIYDAVDDLRTREAHRQWDRRTLPVTDPWWRTHYPPNGYNSIVPDQRVSGHALLGLKAWYSGNVVEVVGASGGRFTVTAQHPVLTTRGWVDAQSLREGDELVAYRDDVGRSAVAADHDENNAPPTIEQVFDALALGARASVPRAALHLNGDSYFFESDVEVVGADGVLVNRIEAAAREFAAKVDLLNSTQGQRLRSRLGALASLVVGDVSVFRGNGSDQSEPSLRAEAVLSVLRSDRIRFDPVRAKVTSDVLSTLAQLRPDLAQAHPLVIETEYLLRDWFADLGSLAPEKPVAYQPRGLRTGSLDPRIADDPIGGFGVNANAFRDIADRHAADVQIDRVASLRVSNYSGHVYDLQTVSGTILLYGGRSMHHYVVSNCRCGVIQVSREELDAMGIKPGTAPAERTYLWGNPRTGVSERVPVGIDPGFDRNVGQGGTAPPLRQVIKEKTRRAPRKRKETAEAVEAVMRRPFETTTAAGKWHAQTFEKSPEWMRNVILAEQHVDVQKRARNGNAWARAGNLIEMDGLKEADAYGQTVWRHEFGHILDNRLGRRAGLSYVSSEPDFKNAVRKDAEEFYVAAKEKESPFRGLKDGPSKTYSEAEEAISDAKPADYGKVVEAIAKRANVDLPGLLSVIRQSTNLDVSAEAWHVQSAQRVAVIIESIRLRDADEFLRQMSNAGPRGQSATSNPAFYGNMKKDGSLAMLSDLVGASTQNKLMDPKQGWWGHPTSYYRKAPFYAYTEVFANLTVMASHENPYWWTIVSRLAPNMTKAYTDAIGSKP